MSFLVVSTTLRAVCVCASSSSSSLKGGGNDGGGGWEEEGVVGRGIELARHGVTFPTVVCLSANCRVPTRHHHAQRPTIDPAGAAHLAHTTALILSRDRQK